MYRAAVLTVSDRVSRGERPDEGGPLVAELLKNGEITKLSGGRYTAYVWSGEETL